MSATAQIQTPDDRLLKEDEVATLLNVSPITLQQWRVKGGGPLFARLGRAVRYRRADIDAWVARNVRAHTSQVL